MHIDLSSRNRSKGIKATLLAAIMITSVLGLLTPAVQAQPYITISNPVFWELIDVQGGAWDTVLWYAMLDLLSGNWRANLRIGNNQAWIDPNYFPNSSSVITASRITSMLRNNAPNPYGLAARVVIIDMDANMVNSATNLGLRGNRWVVSEPWVMEQTYKITNNGTDTQEDMAFFMYYFPSPYGSYPTNFRPSHVDYTAGIPDPMGYVYDITYYGEGAPNWAYTGLSASVTPTAHDVGHAGGYPDPPYYTPSPWRPSALPSDVLRQVEGDTLRGWASYDAPTGLDPNAIGGALKWDIGSLAPGESWTIKVLQSVAPYDAPIWSRTLDKTVVKKVKMIPAPVQFWREFIGGVTDIIVSDPPDWPPEGVALVRDYAVLHDGEGPIPLERLTWEETQDLPWIPIDTREEPCILRPGEVAEYDIPTDPAVTAVLVRYTVAWASSQDVIETHFINEAILESKSPQVIVGQLSNFDVHNDYHEPVDNFELELYGIQPSDIVGWFPGWGTPPEINPIPPSPDGTMPGGTEIIWMDPDNPVMPCEWEHFGLYLKPGVIAAGVKAYWTQLPSAELGDVVHVKLTVTVPPGETATVVDTLPSMVEYITGTFTVDGVPATPTITTTRPPPPIITKISYTLITPGTHVIKFDVKVDEAKNWEDTEVCNIAIATWFDEAGEEIETKVDVECFTIHPFEELHKNVGIPKADVVFAIDLTGSMTTELGVIQTQAPTIINNIASQIADVKFGLITYMDYVGTYTTTSTVPGAVPLTYTETYGSAASGDYPYKLDQDIGGAAAVIAAIGGLTSGNGVDWPQDYSRILHESWNSLTSPNPADHLHWRPGATRFLVLFGDAWPHDTGFDYDNNGVPNNAGGDPGRDTILGNADDLDFETEVANVAAAGIRVMGVYSGGVGTKYPWTYMADQTGGQYFQLTEAGQIPDAIKEILKAEAQETLVIKEKTETQWALVMDVVNPFPYTMTNTIIKDNFGAEIEIDEIVLMTDCNGDAVVDVLDLSQVARAFGTNPDWPHGTDWHQWNPKTDFNKDDKVDVFDLSLAGQTYGTYVEMELILDETGKSEKVHLWWYIGNLAPGKTARLILLVSTDLNPAGHQEYTEPGIYEMNSGATLKFIDPEQNMQLSAYTDSIYVTVLPLEDP